MKQTTTFSLPINFFDDDRMIPVSALYGPVGELVAIRIVSMIYRNGYFLEWNQLNRCRLLRAIPSLTLDRLDAIVECLISSGLFDADLFTLEGVLTSAEIQTQYLRANRRRIKPDTELPYFLIALPEKKAKPTKNEELPPPATTHLDPFETPDPLETPETPETPETLETPETFETPETLENLDNLDNPGLSDSTDSSGLTDSSDSTDSSGSTDNAGSPVPTKRPLPRGVKLVSSRRPTHRPHKYPCTHPTLLPTKRRYKRRR